MVRFILLSPTPSAPDDIFHTVLRRSPEPLNNMHHHLKHLLMLSCYCSLQLHLLTGFLFRLPIYHLRRQNQDRTEKLSVYLQQPRCEYRSSRKLSVLEFLFHGGESAELQLVCRDFYLCSLPRLHDEKKLISSASELQC